MKEMKYKLENEFGLDRKSFFKEHHELLCILCCFEIY